MLGTPLLARFTPDTALTEMGTFCRFSARRLAVTITSPTIAPSVRAAEAGGA